MTPNQPPTGLSRRARSFLFVDGCDSGFLVTLTAHQAQLSPFVRVICDETVMLLTKGNPVRQVVAEIGPLRTCGDVLGLEIPSRSAAGELAVTVSFSHGLGPAFMLGVPLHLESRLLGPTRLFEVGINLWTHSPGS